MLHILKESLFFIMILFNSITGIYHQLLVF